MGENAAMIAVLADRYRLPWSSAAQKLGNGVWCDVWMPWDLGRFGKRKKLRGQEIHMFRE